MHGDNYFKILNILSLWMGVVLILSGVSKMKDSGYSPPETPAGWVMGMFWITFGGSIAITWTTFISAQLIDQKCTKKKRWTCSQMASTSLVLIIAVGCASIGTYLTWKHPYRIGDCGCTENEWGIQCNPCECVKGVCHSGIYGTGRCSCDFGWSGEKCDECDARHKPEPPIENGVLIIPITAPSCDMCKTGYAGEKCDRCAVGYTGEYCDICAKGWQPWQHSSKNFPNTISFDDNRHLCDECIPNHWGYYCYSCPIGNDVPKITLAKNEPLTNRTRVTDEMGDAGYLSAIETCTDDECKTWTNDMYDHNNPFVLEQTRLKIKYDADNFISDWFLLKDIKGFQCNNRGTCMDDERHQQLQIDNGVDWQSTCTKSSNQMCNTHSDCRQSENCKGICQGIDLPINPLWAIWNGNPGNLCSTDDDCLGPVVDEDSNQNPLYYRGGKCVAKFCCDETYHGTGICDCNEKYFGAKSEEGFKSHYELSPACDFCPGYDWITEEPTSICSGGKGTCSPSYARALEAGVQGEYLNMRCTCGQEAYVDPETKIVTDTVISWSGDLCQCGKVDGDNKCDYCASGHWGAECKKCPGGPGSNACSGHGTCSSGPSGDGSCTCNVNMQSSAWMLGKYIPRYPGDCIDCKSESNDTRTCNECAPNFFGDKCIRCDDTAQIKTSELDDVFQPLGSFNLGKGQSPATPHPVCHPEMPWLCTLACGGGGWCNWGRQGDGRCMCWSNVRANDHTWNPLDNVCIGNHRFNPESNEIFKGVKEQCPVQGFCEGEGSRHYCPDNKESPSEKNCEKVNFEPCGQTIFEGDKKNLEITITDSNWIPSTDWGGARDDSKCTGDKCQMFNKIDWTFANSKITCVADP